MTSPLIKNEKVEVYQKKSDKTVVGEKKARKLINSEKDLMTVREKGRSVTKYMRVKSKESYSPRNEGKSVTKKKGKTGKGKDNHTQAKEIKSPKNGGKKELSTIQQQNTDSYLSLTSKIERQEL